MTIEGQYLTYQEYTELGGSLAEAPFKLLEFESRQIVDKYTFGRLKELSSQKQEVKLCIYKLIETLNSYNMAQTQNKAISSESIDGYSISYTNGTTSLEQAKNSELYDVVNTYLSECYLDNGIPYLYRGLR